MAPWNDPWAIGKLRDCPPPSGRVLALHVQCFFREPGQASGLRQRTSVKRAKSNSAEQISRPCSIARAATSASDQVARQSVSADQFSSTSACAPVGNGTQTVGAASQPRRNARHRRATAAGQMPAGASRSGQSPTAIARTGPLDGSRSAVSRATLPLAGALPLARPPHTAELTSTST